ncbi:MAG: hypothetical protein HYX32_08590 [Actinobacteria bacterium]|nr:hypothetical protein [Actinomycetota bacterium]
MPGRVLASVVAAVALATAAGVTAASTAEAGQPRERVVQQQTADRPRVLFIRGGKGTAGTNSAGPDDRELSDIADLDSSGKGYGLWAKSLVDAGYDVSQLDETGTLQNKIKVDLNAAELSQYKVVIFGSNNATYTAADAAAVSAYVKGGGGVLFMSDLNWGTGYDVAPGSDNALMAPFGIQMQQDNGAIPDKVTTAEFTTTGHPALAGVSSIVGIGTSACTITGFSDPAFRATVLIRYITPVQTAESNGQRTLRQPTGNDGALVVWEPSRGRGACLFDRDPFFNNALAQESHQRLALNLVNWLAGQAG